MLPELRRAALDALLLSDAAAKQRAVMQLASAGFALDPRARLRVPVDTALPGRPPQPALRPPAQVPARGMGTRAGRAALLHAVAHIEFNAINLALDAVWRFAHLPPEFYRDWIRVAAEEARHFELVCGRLAAIGHRYGDFDAHDGLWEMAHKTRHDALARMALVPRVLEARGLDASPQVAAKLARAGDRESAAVIDVILRDEIGHVALGNRWFRFLCTARGLDPIAVDAAVRRDFGAPRARPPFNLEARRAAGFDAEELAALRAGQPAADER